MGTVKVNHVPGVARPVEGTDYEVLEGEPAPGDFIRVRNGGDEMFTVQPEPLLTAAVSVTFDSSDWKAYAYGVLGHIAAPEGSDQEKLVAGMRRYGAILKAARASADDGTIAALDQYDTERTFRKDQVEIFLTFLNEDGEIVTDAELVAIVGGWPER